MKNYKSLKFLGLFLLLITLFVPLSVSAYSDDDYDWYDESFPQTILKKDQN